LDIATGDLKVGSSITLGNSGTITATAFDGDGSLLQNINSDSGSWVKDNVNSKIYVSNTDHRVAIGTTSASELLTVGNDGVNADVVNNIRLNGRKVNADGEICGLYFANSKDTGDGTTGSSASIRASRIGGSNFATQLDFYTNDGVAVGSGTSRLTILGSGNVGIGATSPEASLHINGIGSEFYIGTTASLEAQSAANAPTYFPAREHILARYADTDYRYTSVFNLAKTHEIAFGYSENYTTTASVTYPDAHAIKFKMTPNAGNSTMTERMIIKGNGNVGIGTTSPQTNLHIESSGSTGVDIYGGDTSNPYIFIGEHQSTYSRKWGGKLTYYGDSNVRWLNISVVDDNVETAAITVRRNGHVGVGTESPDTALHVNGTIKAALLSMNGYTMSKPPRVVHIDDNVGGCPPTRPAGDIMSYSLVLSRTAYVYVSVTTILNYGARSDCEIYFGSSHIQSHLTAEDNTSWNPVNITAGGTVGAGTTLIRFRSTRANVVGCQGNWGGMQILIFET
jgi:hypothetical protein